MILCPRHYFNARNAQRFPLLSPEDPVRVQDPAVAVSAYIRYRHMFRKDPRFEENAFIRLPQIQLIFALRLSHKTAPARVLRRTLPGTLRITSSLTS